MSHKNKRIFLVSGYRGTGKDTFYLQTKGEGAIPWNWAVFARQRKDWTMPQGTRVAFADMLKIQVGQELGIDAHKTDKNKVIRGKTLRQHLIDRGKEERRHDEDHWCRLALSETEKAEGDVIITDWRFPNEYKFYNRLYSSVTTIRLFRSEVPVPSREPGSIDDDSERALDTFAPDFVLLPEVETEKEAQAFARLCPWFSAYRRIFPA